MKHFYLFIGALYISFHCNAMEKKTTEYFHGESISSCIKCKMGDEAKLQKFPFLQNAHYWIVFINMLTPCRCSLYLAPKRHVTSFTELTSEELEEYRELLNKWKPIMSKETALEAFNTASESRPSEHFCIECAIRSPRDSGTINTLLQSAAITRNPQALFGKLLQILEPSLKKEALSEKLHLADNPVQLASFQFFTEKEQSLYQRHCFDSSSREKDKTIYTSTKKDPIECFFCKDLRGDFDDPQNQVVFRGVDASALISAGSYANGHLLYCPHTHVTTFEELSREQAMAFLDLQQKCISVLHHKKDELLDGGTFISTQSFIQEGVGSGATVPQHLHGQVVLKDTSSVVEAFYNPKKTVRDLAKIRTILREGFKELQD